MKVPHIELQLDYGFVPELDHVVLQVRVQKSGNEMSVGVENIDMYFATLVN